MLNRDELRAHYRVILDFIKGERAMRARVLAEPRRGKALAEADAAKVSLEVIGAAVGVALAEQAQAEQPLVLDVGHGGAGRGDY